MAHYAFLDENDIVTQVIVGRDENDLVNGVTDWEAYYGERMGQVCKRTSYNTRGGVHYDLEAGEPTADQSKALRKNYAGIGFTYDEEQDAFIPPQPFDSWVLDEDTCLWEAPVAYPEDGGQYTWDEDAGDWIAVETPGA
jgi:hypothetical protein